MIPNLRELASRYKNRLMWQADAINTKQPDVLTEGTSGTSTHSVWEEQRIVEALYLALLGRSPDDAGLLLHSGKLRNGVPLKDVIRDFLVSKEFLTRFRPASLQTFPLDDAPPMSIDVGLSVSEHQSLWRHIAEVWSSYGTNDPFWSVLTDERWRSRNMTDDQIIRSFYATGELEGHRLDAWLRRNDIRVTPTMVCAEYGCGVGRATHVLARRFGKILAFDISKPHIEAARAQLGRMAVSNVDFVLVDGEASLQRLEGVDLFYSIIVLQHNPPPIMIDILRHAFAALSPGGIAFFQIPTYSRNYSFSYPAYRDALEQKKTMEMHFLPQSVVLETGRKHNVHPLEVQPDWCVGHAGEWISNTFLMRKVA